MRPPTGLGGGTIYAPAATLNLSGSTQVGGSGQPSSTLIVNELTLSGATGAYQLTDGSSSDAAVSTFNWITSPVLTVAAEDDTGAGLDPNKVADLGDAMAYLNQALGIVRREPELGRRRHDRRMSRSTSPPRRPRGASPTACSATRRLRTTSTS